MASENGWWELKTTTETNQVDLDHIAELIKEGYTSGEIVGCDEEEGSDIDPDYEAMGADLTPVDPDQPLSGLRGSPVLILRVLQSKGKQALQAKNRRLRL